MGDSVDLVKACLYDVSNYQGASGTFSFDKNGDVERTFVLKQVQKGTFVKIATFS